MREALKFSLLSALCSGVVVLKKNRENSESRLDKVEGPGSEIGIEDEGAVFVTRPCLAKLDYAKVLSGNWI